MEYTFTTANFEEEVLSSDIPVFVDFYADWCGPCKMMAPIVEKLAEKYDGKLKVGKCDTDKEGELAKRYRIMSIPTMMIFAGGEIKETMIGAQPQTELEKKIEQIIA
ncbi:MAG: thioredoxin [Clostridium sp.]|nr:thioredoxin [Clostridium sp.]